MLSSRPLRAMVHPRRSTGWDKDWFNPKRYPPSITSMENHGKSWKIPQLDPLSSKILQLDPLSSMIFPDFFMSPIDFGEFPWAVWGLMLALGHLLGREPDKLHPGHEFAKGGGRFFRSPVVGLKDQHGHPWLGCYQKTVEHHHFSWVNPLFQWPFSIAMLVYQRVNGYPPSGNLHW